MAFADISTAVNRWLVTVSMKSKLVHAVLADADIKEVYNDIKDLQPSHIQKDKADLTKIKEVISTINPFHKDVNKDLLFNIKTGFQAYTKLKTICLPH